MKANSLEVNTQHNYGLEYPKLKMKNEPFIKIDIRY